MNLNGKNGQPTMEEVLASIRRIIAEEPNTAAQTIDLNKRPIIVNGTNQEPETTDFDLPAIFRSSAAPALDKSEPGFGRLTDALRKASSYADDPFHDSAADQTTSPLPDSEENSAPDQHQLHAYQGAAADETEQLSTLRSAAGARPVTPSQSPHLANDNVQPAGNGEGVANANAPHETETPQAGTPAHMGQHAAERPDANSGANDATDSSSGEQKPEVRRQMASFYDTKFKCLGDQAPPNSTKSNTAETNLAPAPGSAHEPAASAPGAPEEVTNNLTEIIAQLADADAVVGANPLVSLGGKSASQETAKEEDAAIQAAVISSSAAVPPPLARKVEQSAPSSATATVEDTTADLLRPMLRQWLAENMPRMVEKALHIELAAGQQDAQTNDPTKS